MARKVRVTRWLDEEGNEHTTAASANYDDAKRTLLAKRAEYGHMEDDEIVDFIQSYADAVSNYVDALLDLKRDAGIKVPR